MLWSLGFEMCESLFRECFEIAHKYAIEQISGEMIQMPELRLKCYIDRILHPCQSEIASGEIGFN